MGMFEDQFGGLGGSKKPKKQKRQKARGYAAYGAPQTVYQPQQIHAQAQQAPTQAQLLQAQYYTQQLPRNLRRSPIPRILRVIAWVLIGLCGIAAVAALVAGFFGRTYLSDRWFIYYDFTFILVAAVYLLAGFLSALPFFYWAKKLELAEEIRNLLRKDGY